MVSNIKINFLLLLSIGIFNKNILNGQDINFTDSLNRKQGAWYKYYPDSVLESFVEYKNDTLNGFFASYNPDGSLLSFGILENGKNEGLTVIFSDGHLHRVSNYKNGLLDGKTVIFYPDGKIKIERIYVNDKIISSKRYEKNNVPKSP